MLFALSLDIIFGYAGMVSFGHAVFWGIGGYSCTLAMNYLFNSVYLGIAMALIVSTGMALIIGIFCTYLTGIYFSILTLAFSQIFYTIAFKWRNFTGGDDGILFRTPVNLGIPGVSGKLAYYYLCLLIVIISFLVCKKIVNSSFGLLLQSIRENEMRVYSVGCNVRKYKIGAFCIAGFFAGLSGALFAPFQGIIFPSVMHWAVSGEVIVMVLIGGSGTLIGAMVGAALVTLIQELVSTFTHRWLIVLGAIYIIAVIFLPQGIIGWISTWFRSYRQEVIRDGY
jgi:branched-chain amino acid transport system permease protein